MPKLVIIETSDIGARYTALASLALGYEPLFICQLANYQADTLSQICEFECIDMLTDDANRLAEVLAGIENIMGVTTLLDSRLEVVVKLAELMGVKGLDPAILPLKDKGLAYELHPQVMPRTLLIDRQNLNVAGINKFLTDHDRFIIKPRKTAGAIGARVFASSTTIDQLINHMNSVNIPEFLDPHAWILQAFVSGQLLSLEGFVHQGEFTAIGVTGRRKIGQTESLANFPADAQLDAEVVDSVNRSCRELLERAGVFSSYFHIEFITGKEGTFIIDANVGRPGGGGIGELLALAYNISPVEVFTHFIQVSLGRAATSPYRDRSGEAISITYGSPKAGLMKSLKNLEVIGGYHTQLLDTGKPVPSMGGDNWAWIGIASGRSPNLLEQLNQVEIQIDHEVFQPCY